MSKVEALEHEIETLSRAELNILRDWFFKFDADAWNRQIEADSRTGKLDAIAKDALAEHSQGKSTEF